MPIEARLAHERSGFVAPPEPDLTPKELVARADAMRATLRERQARCEESGRLPPETHDDFVKAGFYRTLQPRCFGGYELDLPAFVKVIIAISRGCTESGWVLALISGHPVLLAGFPEQAQREAYGETGEFRAPGVALPGGSATPVEGGYRVKGAWDYSSGCDVGTHFLGMTLLNREDSPVPAGLAWVLLDRHQFNIVDNWNVIGMQGTGSRRVVVEEVFVPEHRLMRWADAQGKMASAFPGLALHANPLYHGSKVPVLISEIASVAVGAARGALDVYDETLRRKRRSFPPFEPLCEVPEFQQHFGTAQSLVDTAEAALLQMAADYMEYARLAQEGIPFSDEVERRLLLIEQQCVRLAWDAVELMFRTAGSASAAKSSVLGRYFRNVAVIRTHLTLQLTQTSGSFARAHFGLPALQRF
ncbi:MAG: oxidoreductase [Acidobacteriia bacterium]|nr:oxidoreductase [Terriglobia bacterium]